MVSFGWYVQEHVPVDQVEPVGRVERQMIYSEGDAPSVEDVPSPTVTGAPSIDPVGEGDGGTVGRIP